MKEAKRRLILSLRESLGETILSALDDTTVVEVMLNPDGSLFVERLGKGIHKQGTMSPGAAETVIGKVAHALQTEVSMDRPIISGELPLGGHRFEGILPPAVSSPIFTIRKRASILITLDQYVTDGIMEPAQVAAIRQAMSERSTSWYRVVPERARRRLPMRSSGSWGMLRRIIGW